MKFCFYFSTSELSCHTLLITWLFFFCIVIIILQLQSATLDDLLLQRIDDFDDFTRKTIQLAAVLGRSFSQQEVIQISEQILSIPEKEKGSHADKISSSFALAVQEGIIDEVEDENGVHLISRKMSFESLSSLIDENENDVFIDVNKHFEFRHSSWRHKILSLLLDSYKRDIHMHAASAIQKTISSDDDTSYYTKLRLFMHLKESENSLKAADLALDMGKNLKYLGFNSHSIKIYNEALSMWSQNSNHYGSPDGCDNDNYIAGFSIEDIESLDKFELIEVVKLLTALGQALGTLERTEESSRAFENALKVSYLHPFLLSL